MKTLAYLVTAWLAALLLAAGCYGSTPPVVKLGLIAPFEELHRDDGYAALAAVTLAINQRNAAGGVAGRQVALVALNDNGRPEEARRQVANLAVDQDVLGVVGPLHSVTAAAAGPALAAAGLPWVTLASLAPDQQPAGFALEAQPADVAVLAEELLRVDGVANPVIVGMGASFPATQSPDQQASGLIWLGGAAGGARVAGRLDPDVLLIGGPELGSPVFARRAGDAATGVRWLSAGPQAGALPADFTAAYQELAGAPPSPQAVLAYDATNLLLDALAHAGAGGAALDRQAVFRSLADLGAAGWQGLSGSVTWQSAGCPAPQPCWLRLHPPLSVHQW